MATKEEKIVVPALGESVTEATIGRWAKQLGESIDQDDLLAELETEKVTLEINAPKDGIIKKILAPQGTKVQVGEVIGILEVGNHTSRKPEPSLKSEPDKKKTPSSVEEILSPAVRKLVRENHLNPANLSMSATGKNGRITKEDVIRELKQVEPIFPDSELSENLRDDKGQLEDINFKRAISRHEERVRMTRLRQTIAQRLKDAQNTAAILTTFNEIDMFHVIELRARLKDEFEKKHGIKLGFMSFFVKACTQALKEIPSINAEIEGDEIIYKNYYDIGVAVSTPQGLVVPVVNDADVLTLAEIEKIIAALALKAREGRLEVKDLTGGTFTISNGGVYGSLMSTPILNPPQSGILGMHKIQKRPVVVDEQIQIRPMMYVALSYDHRLIDGADAVRFLVRVKECLEDPERMLLNV